MIVLLGISGSGKNAVGNMIRREMHEAGVSTAIQKITVESGTVAGEKVSLMDTPDWFNSGLSQEEIKENIKRCICMCSCGPYAVLLVIPVKFTKEESEIVENMKLIFEERCWERVMILFTVTNEQDKQNIQFFIKTNFQKLVVNCGNRFHSLNVAQTGNSETQVSDMLGKIEEMIAGRKEGRDVCELTVSEINIAIAKSKRGIMERERNYIKKHPEVLQHAIWISKCASSLSEESANISCSEDKEPGFVTVDMQE